MPHKPRQDALPRHIAVIMDGNGRWAEKRGLTRVRGHEAGATSARALTEECVRQGIEFLTLYAFSLENWTRPRHEVSTLMSYLKRFLRKERATVMDNNVRLALTGQLDRLPAAVRKEAEGLVKDSASNTGLLLCVALSYGGRQEIADACKMIAREVAAGTLSPDKITEETIRSHLYHPEIPDPDLVIRTGGEMRISNFLLWQISYSELHVTPVLWPDFREAHLIEALDVYRKRVRRYGGLAETSGRKDRVRTTPT